jgi:hypothetical protein
MSFGAIFIYARNYIMKNFRNYLTYSNPKHKTYGKVYHNKDLKEAVFTDGRFMIISKELFDESKDVEYLKKNVDKDFDYNSFDYRKIIYPTEEYAEIDSKKFRKEILLADEKLYDSTISYEDALTTKVFFKDFSICFTSAIIHVVAEFLRDNRGMDIFVFLNASDLSKNARIMVFDSDPLADVHSLINEMFFMPVVPDTKYQIVIENNELKYENSTWQASIENRYSWSDMANELTSRGIPHEVVRNLADTTMAICYNRPIMSIFKFDDYLHDRFGRYESEGKSMGDMFVQLFGEDADKIAYYFGIEKEQK